MSHSYPSDISREQFARILPTLESARRRTKPRTVDLYDVFCGVLYLLKSGCQWRMLPADFSKRLLRCWETGRRPPVASSVSAICWTASQLRTCAGPSATWSDWWATSATAVMPGNSATFASFGNPSHAAGPRACGTLS